MINNYMEYLFSKDTYQQLLILKALFNNSEGMDIENLTTIINVDRRTIYNHLNFINKICEKYHHSGNIIVSKKWKYYFSGNKIDYYNLRSYLLEPESLLKLSELFLNNSAVNFTNFCRENFIGESTLKKKISKVNLLLKSTGLKIVIRKNFISILGEERIIRYCLISLLWRVYRRTRWPFKLLEEKTIDSLVSSIVLDGRKISYGKRKQLSFYLAVYLSRVKTNHLILEEHLPNYSTQLILKNNYLSKLSDTIKKFFEIPDKEVAFILLTFYTFPESYNYFQDTASTLVLLKNFSEQSYNSLIKFVNYIELKHPKWDKNAPSSSLFWSVLISGRIFVDIFGDIYFNSSAVRIFKHANTESPHLLPSIKKEIQTIEPNLSKNTLKSLTLRYAQAYILEFSPQDFEPEIKILLLTDVALYIDMITQERIENLLHDKYNYTLERNFAIGKPDLILSTGLIEDKYKRSKVIYINSEVNKKDVENIFKSCKEILLSKKKNEIKDSPNIKRL